MRRVLIVDDDEGFRESLTVLLTLEGFEVQVAANGEEGLTELLTASHQPDVVLVDLMMPEMSGWDLIEAMKGDAALARIPAAVVTAAGCPRRIPSTMAVFQKPFPVPELLQFIRCAN